MTKKTQRKKRHARVRGKVNGALQRPRLSVFRSNRHIYAQVIDDVQGHTLAAASGQDSREVGAALAQRAQEAGITQVVFDRGGFKYHGRVKQLAEGAREGGLRF